MYERIKLSIPSPHYLQIKSTASLNSCNFGVKIFLHDFAEGEAKDRLAHFLIAPPAKQYQTKHFQQICIFDFFTFFSIMELFNGYFEIKFIFLMLALIFPGNTHNR